MNALPLLQCQDLVKYFNNLCIPFKVNHVVAPSSSTGQPPSSPQSSKASSVVVSQGSQLVEDGVATALINLIQKR